MEEGFYGVAGEFRRIGGVKTVALSEDGRVGEAASPSAVETTLVVVESAILH